MRENKYIIRKEQNGFSDIIRCFCVDSCHLRIVKYELESFHLLPQCMDVSKVHNFAKKRLKLRFFGVFCIPKGEGFGGIHQIVSQLYNLRSLFVCWYVCLFACLFVCLYVCLFACLYVCLFG